MPTYTAYGLVIETEFPVPELVPAEGAPDVLIRVGPVPERQDADTARGVLFESHPRRFFLNIDGVGRYLVSEGRVVVVQPAPAASWTTSYRLTELADAIEDDLRSYARPRVLVEETGS